jgi:hypothetical protein
LSQPLLHLHFRLFVTSEMSATFLDPTVNHFTWQTLPTVRRKHFFKISFAHKKPSTEHWSSVVQPQAWSPFWLLMPASEHKHACLLSRLSWSWNVQLPSDPPRNRKPYTISVSGNGQNTQVANLSVPSKSSLLVI